MRIVTQVSSVTKHCITMHRVHFKETPKAQAGNSIENHMIEDGWQLHTGASEKGKPRDDVLPCQMNMSKM